MSHNVAVLDYGLGNLFSVDMACRAVGLKSLVTSDPRAVDDAAAVILPGVGAFGTAMHRLHERGLDGALYRAVEQGRQVMGICLGMQLLMEESHEFGCNRGLGLIKGSVRRLMASEIGGRRVTVPHVDWKPLHPPVTTNAWNGTLLEGLSAGVWMYFVHSFVVCPEEEVTLCLVEHGTDHFCGALARDNIFACQFHPERSGGPGLAVYANMAARLGISASGAEY